MKAILIFCSFCLIAVNGFSQNKFSCIITDAGTGEPLPNVSIIAKGHLVNTVTDNNGKAILKNIPDGKIVL
ncbi:MAG TPA: carboxypeptidase-like regulatory domain-containing protein, partial [Chitinophagaceae bacterium]